MKKLLCATTMLIVIAAGNLLAEEPKPAHPGKGQPQVMRLEITGDHYMIQGLGALVTGSGDTVRIQFIPPGDSRPKDLTTVNIETGDLIAMLNGKKVASVKDFEARYEAIATGSEVKVGLKRGAQLVMASFKKPDASALPKGMTMIQTTDDGSGSWNSDGPKGDIVLSAAGVGVSEIEGKPTIVSAFEPEGKGITGDVPEVGDVVTEVSGTAVANLDDFHKAMGKFAMGKDVTLKLSRKGEAKTFTFTRGGGK